MHAIEKGRLKSKRKVDKQGKSSYYAARDLLRQVPDAQTAAFLIKARRLIVLAAGNRPPAQAPACLRVRTEQGKSWPRVEMVMPMAQGGESIDGSANDAHNEEQRQEQVQEQEQEQKQGQEREQERQDKAVTFLLGLDGPGGKTLPAGVFVGVMDFLIPSWDPLRAGMGGQQKREAWEGMSELLKGGPWDQTAMIDAL